jgi:hypothetical protein
VTTAHRRFFLVERYAPAATARSVAAAAQRLAGADDSARHVATVVIVGDETCLSVFEARDANVVAAVNEAAGLPVDRIVEAEWFPASPR